MESERRFKPIVLAKKVFKACVLQAEILIETIEIEIWKRRHGEEFRQKYKNSKLVHPDVIKIYRDGYDRKPE